MLMETARDVWSYVSTTNTITLEHRAALRKLVRSIEQ